MLHNRQVGGFSQRVGLMVSIFLFNHSIRFLV